MGIELLPPSSHHLSNAAGNDRIGAGADGDIFPPSIVPASQQDLSTVEQLKKEPQQQEEQVENIYVMILDGMTFQTQVGAPAPRPNDQSVWSPWNGTCQVSNYSRI